MSTAATAASCLAQPRHGRGGGSVRRRTRGFTLVELLIALGLIALILLLLFSGLRLGSRAWEGVEGLAERAGEERVARSFLTNTLLQVRAASVTFDGEQRPVFAGDTGHLEFAAPLAARVGIPGLYLLRLSLADVEGRPALVLTRWLLHPDILVGTDSVPAWQPLASGGRYVDPGDFLDADAAAGAFGATVLLEDVKVFEIAYFGRRPEDGELDWSDDWSDEPMLPERVLIHIETSAGHWPELVFDLPTDGSRRRRPPP